MWCVMPKKKYIVSLTLFYDSGERKIFISLDTLNLLTAFNNAGALVSEILGMN